MIIINLPNNISFNTANLNNQYINNNNQVSANPDVYYIKITNSYNYYIQEYPFYFILNDNNNGEFTQQNNQDNFKFVDNNTGEVISYNVDLFDKENKKLRFVLKIKNMLPNENRYIKYNIE